MIQVSNNKYFFILSLLLFCCNEKSQERHLNSDKLTLIEEEGLIIPLDSVSPHKPPFIQFLEEDSILTFYNNFNRSIYWFDLKENKYLDRTFIYPEGENQISRPVGYHIINKDSIYVFDMAKNELALINYEGVKINQCSLIENRSMSDAQWALYFPQFFPKTVTPFLKIDNELVFSGSYMWSIPDNILDTFKFTTMYSLKNNNNVYIHSYPKSKYGSIYNWDDPYYTMVYYDWNPIEKLMVYSFPITNSLYTGSLQEGNLLEKIDFEVGSKTVKPISNKRPTREMMLNHLLESDIYSGIKFDKYRNVYYRVLMNGMSDAGDFKDLSEKTISIIIYDNEFNIIGKKNIGSYKYWNTDNMIVSKDGLLVEYIDIYSSNEDFMILKSFKLSKNEN